MATLAAQLASWQSHKGAFLSTVTSPRGIEADYNGFVTALVLRELRHIPPEPHLDSIRNRALDFLETCTSPEGAGAFGFWPLDARPTWAMHVPMDADDTAVMALELARYGRLNRQDLVKIICKILLRHRVSRHHPVSSPWIIPGSFLTWLADSSQRSNVVDCCVNVNAVALMAYANAVHLPGYQEACHMVDVGIDWAENSPQKLLSLTPFYPHSLELYLAMQHAIECGAIALEKAFARLNHLVKGAIASPNQPVCSSAYHAVVWQCPALATVRQHRSP